MPRVVGPPDALPKPPPLSALLFAVCGGILLDQSLPVHAGCWWVGSLIGLAIWARCAQTLPKTGLTCLLIAVASVAACWHHVRWHVYPVNHLVRFAPANDQHSLPIRIIGVVGSAPRLIPEDVTRPAPLAAGDRTRFVFEAQQIGPSPGILVSGTATVTVQGHLLGVQVGDVVKIDGRLRAIPGPMNPGQLDPRHHFRGIRRLAALDVPYPDSVNVIDRETHRLRRLPTRVRSTAESVLKQHVASDQYGLAAALLLGAREPLQPSAKDAFFHTGTIHLLAVSGLHVGILASAFLTAARGRVLPWRPALYAVMLLTLAYAAVTETRAPVVRASLLVQILCLSWIIRRRLSAVSAMSAAGLIVLAQNPSELFSTGTQLSFLAVATLHWVGSRLHWRAHPTDPIERLLWKSRSPLWRLAQHLLLTLRQMALASLAVWLVTLPLVAYRFHLISPWSVPLNLVLWVPVAIALFAGLGIFLFHCWLTPIAELCGEICAASLWSLQLVVDSVEPLPGSHVWVAGPSGLWVSLFYLGVGLTAWSQSLRRCRLWWIGLVFVGVALPTVEHLIKRSQSADGLRCTILAVGHGNCVFLEFPSGFKMLYDAGRIGITRPSVERVSRFLWSRRVRRIDAVVISHADADHYNLLPELLHRFQVTALYTNPRPSTDDPLLPLIESARRRGVSVRQLSDGCELAPSANCRIRVLHPPSNRLSDSDNANSVVLAIESAGRTVLLPGDLEASGLTRLLKKQPMDVDLTMAPHHGSLKSMPAAYSAWCSPEWIVISGNKTEMAAELRKCLPHDEARVLHTAEIGAVEIRVRADGLRVNGYRRAATAFRQSE